MQPDLSQEKGWGGRSKRRAPFPQRPTIVRQSQRRIQSRGSFIHSSGSSAVTDHPLCARPEVGAGETHIREPHEMSEGSLGVMGIRADCLEEGSPRNLENPPHASQLSLGAKEDIGPKVFPSVRGEESPECSRVSWISTHSLIRSFVHPFIPHEPLLRQAEVTQTQKRDSGANKQVQICVKGGGRWTASAREAESSGSVVENRLPGPPSDHWLPVGVGAGNCILKPLGAWRWLSLAPTC